MIDTCPICHQLHTTLACPTHPTALLQLEADAGAVPGCTTECAKMREENTKLRAALAVSKDPCVYCQLPAEEMARCRAGFPGCARADDMTGCPEFGAAMNEHALLDDLASLRADAEAVRAVLNGIADYGWAYGSGCTFTINCASLAEARQLDDLLTRALMARRQEEGQNK